MQKPCRAIHENIHVLTTVSVGYTIEKVYEIWTFDETTQYDASTNTDGIFAEYVNMWMKVKMEASGDYRNYTEPSILASGTFKDYDDELFTAQNQQATSWYQNSQLIGDASAAEDSSGIAEEPAKQGSEWGNDVELEEEEDRWRVNFWRRSRQPKSLQPAERR